MSEPRFRAVKGTRDVLPPESARWEALLARFATHVERGGYGLLQSPTFEDVEVFRRVGEGTDVVRKEMYEFEDRSGQRLALRPEGTASVARAFVQHRPAIPWKVWYATPSFRAENVQAGRYRQHHQLGIECLGTDDPDADVEVIGLLWDFYKDLGLRRLTLLLNSMGDGVCRPAYLDLLRGYLLERRSALCDEHRDRVADHPLRVLDCRRAACRAATADAPRLVDHLCPECKAHFESVQVGLGALEIPFIIETRLVRGLDYYTRTTFEVQADALAAAQNGLGGGGRYDGLVESMGAPPTPGIGFGTGIERILLTCDGEGVFPVEPKSVSVWVVDVTSSGAARDLTAELRRAGISTDRAFDHKSMKAQMKKANSSGARLALIVGDQEWADGTVAVRDLRAEGDAQEAVGRGDVVDHVRKVLGP